MIKLNFQTTSEIERMCGGQSGRQMSFRLSMAHAMKYKNISN